MTLLSTTREKAASLALALLASFFLFNCNASAATTLSIKTTSDPLKCLLGFNFNNLKQVNFLNGAPSYRLDTSNNFYDCNGLKLTPGFSNYSVTNPGEILLSAPTIYSTNMSIYDPNSKNPTTTLNNIINVSDNKYLNTSAIGKSKIYSCTESGNIYSIDPSVVTAGSFNKLSPVQIDPNNKTMIESCVADSSQTTGDIVYSLSLVSGDSNNWHLCATTAPADTTKDGTTACLPNPIFLQSPTNMKMLATNGIVFVEDTTNNQVTIQAFTTSQDGKTLIPYTGFKTATIPNVKEAVSPLVYDSKNNIIYLVISNGSSNILESVDGSGLSWSFTFDAGVQTSTPFISTTSKNIIVITTNKIFGAEYLGNGQYDGAFISGFYTGFPQPSTAAPNLTILDSNASMPIIDVPVVQDGTTGITAYSIYINY